MFTHSRLWEPAGDQPDKFVSRVFFHASSVMGPRIKDLFYWGSQTERKNSRKCRYYGTCNAADPYQIRIQKLPYFNFFFGLINTQNIEQKYVI
jgi:hypothetical protein